MRLAPLALADLSEKEWMAQGAELARTLGWLRFHPYRSDRSEPGWPDDALVRERLVFVEWKTERGKLSDAQKRWLSALLDAGQEVYVARPKDLPALASILAARGNPFCKEPRVEWKDATNLLSSLNRELGRVGGAGRG